MLSVYSQAHTRRLQARQRTDSRGRVRVIDFAVTRTNVRERVEDELSTLERLPGRLVLDRRHVVLDG